MLASGCLAGVPGVDGGIELHAGVTTDVGAFGNFTQDLTGVFLFARVAVADVAGPVVLTFDGGVHEFIPDAHREVFILIHHGAVGVAVVGSIVSLFDECPGFFLFDGFGFNEFLDVRVPVFQGVHFCRSPGFAAGFDDVGDLVVNAEEGERAGWVAAAGEFFAGGAQGGEIGTCAGAIFEEHGFGGGKAHDVFHVVFYALDETGASLWVFILGGGTDGFIVFV